jgi:hypothetical protein
MIFPSLIAISLILETMARATTIDFPENLLAVSDLGTITVNPKRFWTRSSQSSLGNGEMVVGSRKYELTELCALFMGRPGKIAYTVTIGVFLYGTLWAFSSVFGNALATHIGFGPASYYVYLLLFAVIVVPFSCMEISEQMTMQVILALCRVVMVIFMVSSVAAAFESESEPFGEDTRNKNMRSHLFELTGLHVILPISMFANMFHHSVPALSEPAKDKHALGNIFMTALMSCFVAYSLIGVTLSLYFGSAVKSSANLNWSDYGSFYNGFAPAMQKIVSTYVIIFPALDVASAYPLNAITLGNSLYTSVYGDEAKNLPKIYRIAFRLLAAVPPIVGASVVSDLGAITDFTGILGMAVGFVFPPLLAYYSEKYFLDRHLSPATVYSTVWTSRRWVMTVLGFGIFMIFFNLISIAVYGVPE